MEMKHVAATGPVRVHIGELVVDGYPGMDGAALSDAVRGELTRLITEGGVGNQTGGTVPKITAPPVQSGAHADAATLGAEVARSVYGGLKR